MAIKRGVLLLSVSILLTGCAHQDADLGGGGHVGAGAYPYGGLTECSGYVYDYDPYNPYYADDYAGPCRGYGHRYYGYPYSYTNAPQVQQRQRVAALERSNHPRVVGPRSPAGSPSQSSFASSSAPSASSSMRASAVQSSGDHSSTRTVSARR